MHSMSTAPVFNKLTTLSGEEYDIKRKNDKVFGVRCTRMQGKKDSSLSSKWEDVNEYLSCGLNSLRRAWTPFADCWTILLTSAPFEQAAEDIIETYKAENLVHMLDINNLFVREYTPLSSIDVFHSLVDIGEEIFRDARPRNEDESKRIDDFVRSKAKTISSRPL